MKNIFVLILLVASVFQVKAQQSWVTDPFHSSVNFTISHSGITLVPGEFDKFEGKLMFTKADLTDAKIEFTVDTRSINTGVEMRDNHLRSADFFEVEKYPFMTFKSISLELTKEKNYKLYGNLTIKDITKPVMFDVIYGGSAKDQKGNEKIGFTATASIDRLDYHINYDPTGMGVGKTANITIYLELHKAGSAQK